MKVGQNGPTLLIIKRAMQLELGREEQSSVAV